LLIVSLSNVFFHHPIGLVGMSIKQRAATQLRDDGKNGIAVAIGEENDRDRKTGSPAPRRNLADINQTVDAATERSRQTKPASAASTPQF
jgi:hypothetical protein